MKKLLLGTRLNGVCSVALKYFGEMQFLIDDINIRPDVITIASVLSACAYLGAIGYGKWMHCYLRRSGLECDMVIVLH